MDCESTGSTGELRRKAYDQYELGLASADKRERSAQFHRAAELARQIIEADPQSAEGYKWLAIAQGAQAEDADVETQIRLSRQIKENIEKALSLDPDDDISMLVLSRWHYKVASLDGWTRALVTLVYGSLPEASLEKAEALLLEAIAKTDRIVHRYSLAKVYHRMGKREAALQQLRLALALPVTFASEADDLERARKKLDSWK
jgi:tetratricopeptide (TPR) repeat protein